MNDVRREAHQCGYPLTWGRMYYIISFLFGEGIVPGKGETQVSDKAIYSIKVMTSLNLDYF